ncbi:Protein FAR1-RELATED SEQUENCE 9, partial [Bienertia sinuspersici]
MRSFGLSNVNVNAHILLCEGGNCKGRSDIFICNRGCVWKTGKGGIHEYLTPKRRLYNCEHNIVEKEIRCSCKMFETHGILCCHVIRVMDMNLMKNPQKSMFCDAGIRYKAETRCCRSLKRISDEVRSYNGAHVDEGGGMKGVGDIDSVHSSEPIGSNTQRTAVSGTLHGEQTQAPAPPTDNSSVNVVGQSEGSQPSVRINVVADQDRVNKQQQWYVEILLYRRKKVGQKVLATRVQNGGTGGKRKYQ